MFFLIASPALNGESLLSPDTARACQDCGAYTHPWEDHGDLKKKLKQDWSVTNDGLQVVSPRFKTIVEDHAIEGVEFRPLSNGCFLFRVLNVVYFDS